MLAPQELALQVDGDQTVEDGHVEGGDVGVDGVEGGVRRVVVQDIEPAERLHSSLDHARDGRFVGNVDLDWHRLIELPGNAFCFGSVEVGDKNSAPSRAMTRAVASPIPLPAPVTIATLPSSRPIRRVCQRL